MEKLLKKESLRKERKTRDRAEMNWLWIWNGWKVSLRHVSIEDRSVVGSVDRGLNSTNCMPGVGGSRNR